MRHLNEIEQIPNEPSDPPDEKWMRNMDDSRPMMREFVLLNSRPLGHACRLPGVQSGINIANGFGICSDGVPWSSFPRSPMMKYDGS